MGSHVMDPRFQVGGGRHTSYHVDWQDLPRNPEVLSRGKLVSEGFFCQRLQIPTNLTLPKIFIDYGGFTMFAQIFAVVKQCDHALCQHDITVLVSLLVDSNIFRQTSVAAEGLTKTKVGKTLYCWSCGHAGYAKKDWPSMQRHVHNMNNPKQKPVVLFKDLKNNIDKYLPKQLKYCRSEQPRSEKLLHFALKNDFLLNVKKHWKQKLAYWTRSSKIWHHQILDLPALCGAMANSSTPDYYMFGASGEVIGSTIGTRSQFVSRATPLTIEEFMEILLGTIGLQIRLVKHGYHYLLD